MYDELVALLRKKYDKAPMVMEAADAIEELSKRINRAVELYDRGVERSAMYEALKGISPEPPKEKA